MNVVDVDVDSKEKKGNKGNPTTLFIGQCNIRTQMLLKKESIQQRLLACVPCARSS